MTTTCQGCGAPIDPNARFCRYCGRPQFQLSPQMQAAWGWHTSPLGTVMLAVPHGWFVQFSGDELTLGMLIVQDPAGQARYIRFPSRNYREPSKGWGWLGAMFSDIDLSAFPALAYLPAAQFLAQHAAQAIGIPNARVQIVKTLTCQGRRFNVGGQADVAYADFAAVLGDVPVRGRLLCETARSALVNGRLWSADVWTWFAPETLWSRASAILGQIATSFRVDEMRTAALVQQRMAQSYAAAQQAQVDLLMQHAARMRELNAQALAIQTSPPPVSSAGSEPISGQGYLDALGGTQRLADDQGHEYWGEPGYDRYFVHRWGGEPQGFRYGEQVPENVPDWYEVHLPK